MYTGAACYFQRQICAVNKKEPKAATASYYNCELQFLQGYCEDIIRECTLWGLQCLDSLGTQKWGEKANLGRGRGIWWGAEDNLWFHISLQLLKKKIVCPSALEGKKHACQIPKPWRKLTCLKDKKVKGTDSPHFNDVIRKMVSDISKKKHPRMPIPFYPMLLW